MIFADWKYADKITDERGDEKGEIGKVNKRYIKPRSTIGEYQWQKTGKHTSGTQYHDAYAPIEIAHNGNNLIYLLLVPFKQGLVEHVSYSRTDT